jgi:hypothetical protein
MYDAIQTYASVLCKQLDMYKLALCDLRAVALTDGVHLAEGDDDARILATVGYTIELVEGALQQMAGLI